MKQFLGLMILYLPVQHFLSQGPLLGLPLPRQQNISPLEIPLVSDFVYPGSYRHGYQQ